MKNVHKFKTIGLFLALIFVFSNSMFALEKRNAPSSATSIEIPLLKTQWGQRIGRLQFSPNREGASCVPVAIAQILYSLNVPIEGSKSYSTSKSIYWRDFDAYSPQYSSLPLAFDDDTAKDAQMREYDHFLYNCAILLNHAWEDAEVHQEGFAKRIKAHVPVEVETFYYAYSNHTNLTKQEFQNKIIECLKAKKPVMYSIYSADKVISHAVVIDGVRTTGRDFQVHINFGWNGVCDGWYDLWSPILVKDHTMEGGYRRYDSEERQLNVLTPLTGAAKSAWKPERLSAEQLRNIQNERRKVPEIVNGTLYIPEGTTYLYYNDYKNNRQIQKIKFPSTFKGTTKNTNLFEGCVNLKEVEFPESMERLSENTFLNCTKLEKVIYNGKWTDDAYTDAFAGCNNLTTAIFTSSCKTVPSGIFWKVNSVKNVTLAEGVESINYGAFYETSIASIQIPSTVKEIGSYAFYKTSLTEVYIPSSVVKMGDTVFSKSVKIICDEGSYAQSWAQEKGYSTREPLDGPEYTITNGVLTFNSKLKTIDASQFKGNSQIREVVIGENITSIGKSAFEGCANLKKIQFNAINVEIANSSSVNIFKNCPVEELVFGPKVQVVPRQAFRNLNSLKYVKIPGNVKEIQQSAFYGDKTIEEIVIEEGVETLVQYCFYGLPLKKITLPSSIRSIETGALPKSAEVICPANSYAEDSAIQNGNEVPSAFNLLDGVLTIKEGIKTIPEGKYMGNTQIRELVIPSTVTKIGGDAFKNCTSLMKVTYKAVACTSAGNGGSTVTAAFVGCTKLSQVIIAEGVTTIPANIFRECPALKNVIFPSSLKKINSSAFYKTGFEELVIPEGLEEISYTCFSSNSNLKTVRLPSSVTSIQNNAFDKRGVKFYVKSESYAEQWCKSQNVEYIAE